jgi:hypothetical protein
MTREGHRSPSGYSPVGDTADGMNTVLEPTAWDEACHRILSALAEIRREIEIAELTVEGQDLEGTAYHLRRAFAQLKFAGGLIADRSKIKT